MCGLFTGEGIGEEADDPAGYFIDGSSNGQLRFEIAQESVQHFAALLSWVLQIIPLPSTELFQEELLDLDQLKYLKIFKLVDFINFL